MEEKNNINDSIKTNRLHGGNWMTPSYNPKYEAGGFCITLEQMYDRERRSYANFYRAIAIEQIQSATDEEKNDV